MCKPITRSEHKHLRVVLCVTLLCGYWVSFGCFSLVFLREESEAGYGDNETVDFRARVRVSCWHYPVFEPFGHAADVYCCKKLQQHHDCARCVHVLYHCCVADWGYDL